MRHCMAQYFPAVLPEFVKLGDAQIIFSIDPARDDSGAGDLALRLENISCDSIIRIIAVIKDKRHEGFCIGHDSRVSDRYRAAR
jgi:hypothetical protein